ncbi:glycosyltransferase [Candidatus Eisenbacteria bacterium]|uniref:Glycosyltransferase n=1 Tax=Eiseniibacteriota bacterium TaxID=2212470 RepID=A0ABV6YL97_UNCEI
MTEGIQRYAEVVGEDVIHHLYQLAEPLRGWKVVHVNSTRVGGGVAEILAKLVPLMEELGLAASWEVITGGDDFYQCTKRFHNGLQGNMVDLPQRLLTAYEDTNTQNAETLRPVLEDADVVIIHDPQPAPLLALCPKRRGKWVWRCHIDVSRPFRPVWRYLRNHVSSYDASIFSLADFAQPLPHTQYLISPSIDPLSEKNMELSAEEIQAVYTQFGIDPNRPVITQVSRFDRFKDPVGVIRAYRLATEFIPSLQLVLAGGEATDDPEGAAVLEEVKAAAGDDTNIHILLLPADAHRTINALQRISDIVLQKSIKEGFGLTVTEGMWKGKPVIGGNTGGIHLQVINHHTGFLVDTPEGAALRIRYLLNQRSRLEEMGAKAKEFVRENFLLTRHLREYLTLMLALTHGEEGRIELG